VLTHVSASRPSAAVLLNAMISPGVADHGVHD